MERDEKKVTSEELMKEVRQRVEQKIEDGTYSKRPPQFPETLPYSMLRKQKTESDEAYNMLHTHAEIPLEGAPIHSHRKVAGWLIVGIKKFFRYWTRKYTDWLFARQINFNYQVADMLTGLKDRIARLEEKIDELEKHALNDDKKNEQ